jgi:hypothetical protein
LTVGFGLLGATLLGSKGKPVTSRLLKWSIIMGVFYFLLFGILLNPTLPL